MTLLLVDGRETGDAALEGYLAWLAEGELARYRRFVREERRRQFVLGRVLARHALGELLGVAPRELVLEERVGKGPALCGPHKAAGLSISHSGPWVACAVSGETALGLDIEAIDPARDIGALAAQAFDAEQIAWLAGRPAESRTKDFYMLWSAHEARIKLGQPCGQQLEFAHPDLSVVLCSALPLAGVAGLRRVALA